MTKYIVLAILMGIVGFAIDLYGSIHLHNWAIGWSGVGIEALAFVFLVLAAKK